MTLQQIERKRCSVCHAVIFLDSNIISSMNGKRIPIDSNGLPHDRSHGYIHRKSKEIQYQREYQESLNTILEEYESREVI